MRAITLTQPWASLVAIEAKRIETRSWGTHYRGPIAIHAAKGFGKILGGRSLADFCLDEPFASALFAGGIRYLVAGQDLPLGKVVAIAKLADCIAIGAGTAALLGLSRQEQAFGDFTPGRFAWVLRQVQRLPEPIPARGSLGLWEWEIPAGMELLQGRLP